MHYDFVKAPLLWPKAKYLNIVRDPRDVAASVVKTKWEQNVYDASVWWKEAVADWNSLKVQLDPEMWIEIRFEELVDDYPFVLKQICKFMQIEYISEMLSYADDTDYELPSSSLASKWSKSMSDRDVRLTETQIYRLMETQGYRPRHTSLQPLSKFD